MEVVRPERLELPTLCSEGRCSIQLSYGRPECILRQTRLEMFAPRYSISKLK
jgi:hypothetical protein